MFTVIESKKDVIVNQISKFVYNEINSSHVLKRKISWYTW